MRERECVCVCGGGVLSGGASIKASILNAVFLVRTIPIFQYGHFRDFDYTESDQGQDQGIKAN